MFTITNFNYSTMSFINLHLENTKLPTNYAEIILNDSPLTPELKKQGFDKGRAPIYWTSSADNVQLSILQNDEGGKVKLEHRILFFTSGDNFREFENFINDWAKENKIKGDTSRRWAEWFVQIINADPILDKLATNEGDISVNAPSGWKNVFISSPKLEIFDRLRTILSTALRELETAKFKDIDQVFIAAGTDIANIAQCVDYLYEKQEDLADYTHLWERVNTIFEAHGINSDTIPLLAAICGVPSRKLKKEVEKLSNTFDIKNKLADDVELAEELFFELQQHIGGYYTVLSSGYATKALVKKIAKMFAQACESFGFGIYPNGLVTVIRLFENDVVEGISLDSYQSDEVYDAEEYGYYDSEENEEYYDDFWSKIDIQALIK